MADDEAKELRACVERWRLASAKFEELRRQNLRNVNVAERIEAMNGAFEAALSTQRRTTSGLVEQQAIFAKLRNARSVPRRQERPEETMGKLDIADCINETCPWSGEPVQADSLTEYDGHVVGFCNTGCRDKFDAAIHHFEKAKAARMSR